MVDAGEDPMAVTMKIRRDTRVAKDRAVAERAVAAGELQLPPPMPAAGGALHAAQAAKGVALVPSEPAGRDDRVDPGAAYRRARMGFVAAAALVLLLLWVRQRRRGARV